MFGMSFGSSVPQENKKEVLLHNEEIFETLHQLGFVDSATALSTEDYSSINNRMDILQKKRPMDNDLAMALAYIDRMIVREKGNEAAESHLISSVTADTISSLVTDQKLSNDGEFLNTVINTAAEKYKEGTFQAYSDALLAALKAREGAIAEGYDVKIDGQENVVQKSDETLL